MVVKKVLMVDDERPFLLSLADGLAAHAKDFEVVTALNGKEAVKVLDSTGVDLMVTDLRMPEIDGFGLLAHMSGSYPDIPVIVMTAYGTPEIEERLETMGTFHYLEKPLEFDVLADKTEDKSKKEDHIDGKSKEVIGVNIKKLNKIIEDLKEDCGDGLIATDIWAAADGQVITGHNTNPKAAALAVRQLEHINQALKDSKFPELDRYFLFHLKGDLVVVSVILGDYMWGLLFNKKKAQLGLILNVLLPKTIDAFQEAVAA